MPTWKSTKLVIGRSWVQFLIEAVEEFSSPVNFLCLLLFGVHSTPTLLQWHVKDLGHYVKRASGRLHLNRHTPLNQQSRSGLTALSRESMGIYGETAHTHLIRECLSQLAEPLWIDPGLNSAISMRELITTKGRKNVYVGVIKSAFPKNPQVSEEKATTTTTQRLELKH